MDLPPLPVLGLIWLRWQEERRRHDEFVRSLESDRRLRSESRATRGLRRSRPSPELDDELTCASCGQPLDGDPDDEPTGDAGLPICGECTRDGDFGALLESDELDYDR